MKTASLGSGSEGNSHFFECDGTSILVDAGFGPRQMAKRLGMIGRSLDQIDAIVITHEHSDHIRGAEKISRKFGIPVYVTRGTKAGWFLRDDEGVEIIEYPNDSSFRIGELMVHARKTPHDAFDPSSFVIESRAGIRVGLATDLGWFSPAIKLHLANCHAVFFEANHDIDTLRRGDYPWFLKRRILSSVGHLSNDDAVSAAYSLASEYLDTLVMIHLSKQNNTPELVESLVSSALLDIGINPRLAISDQAGATELFEIGGVAPPPRPIRPTQLSLF